MHIHKLAHRLLQPPVTIIVIRARRLGLQPQRLGVRDLGQITRLGIDDFRLLAFKLAEAERRVLLEDFMSVQVVEGFCGIRAGDLREHDGAAGVGVDEVAQVVDFVVDDCPEVFFGVVLAVVVLVDVTFSCCFCCQSSMYLGDFVAVEFLGLHIGYVDLEEEMGENVDRRDERLDSTMVLPQTACLMTYPSHLLCYRGQTNRGCMGGGSLSRLVIGMGPAEGY